MQKVVFWSILVEKWFDFGQKVVRFKQKMVRFKKRFFLVIFFFDLLWRGKEKCRKKRHIFGQIEKMQKNAISALLVRKKSLKLKKELKTKKCTAFSVSFLRKKNFSLLWHGKEKRVKKT